MRLSGPLLGILPAVINSNIEELIDPSVVRPRLTAAAVYIAAFEYVKDYICSQPRNFFSPDALGGKENYRQKVLSLDPNKQPSPIRASLLWFKEMGAIDDSDLAIYKQLRTYRDELSHNLFGLLGAGGLPEGFDERYSQLTDLLRKVALWWIREIEIPCNDEFAGEEIDDDKISGPETGLHLLRTVALGSEQESRSYLRAYWSISGRQDA